MRSVVTALVVSVLLLRPAASTADGMAFRSVSSASHEIRASAQRAIMWHRSSNWEIHVQPVFDRQTGASAWVIPFPVRPQVHASSADLFDQLEIITSPVFIRYCSDDSGGACVAAKADGSGGGSASGSEAAVTVWEQGQVGDLDYAILSASGGDDIAAWLASEGYFLPVPAEAVFAALDAEGQYFFASRVSDGVDPEKPLAPVRFVLPGMDPPVYPLRLTGLGALEGERLDLTLWVIVDDDAGYAPVSHPVTTLPEQPSNGEELDASLDSFFESRTARTLLVLAAVGWDLHTIVSSRQFCTEFMSPCVPFRNLGLDTDLSWLPEIEEILGREQTIYRYQARFSAEAMEEDLVLGPTPRSDMPYASNVYSEHVGDCDEVGPYSFCAMAGRPDAGWLVLALVLAAAGAALLLTRRASPGRGSRAPSRGPWAGP